MARREFADLFAGCGGATTGVWTAAERRKFQLDGGIAINHDPIAVKTHSQNHPKMRHLCESIEKADPNESVPGGRLWLLWASPECTHHSNARGGKPRQNQSRAGASHVLTWMDKLYIDNAIIENVPEFLKWGPLNAKGQPIKAQEGECFRSFIESIRARNYNVEYKILCAADFGDGTTRERLFIICRRKPKKIIWPTPTHRPLNLVDDLFSEFKPYKAMETFIDWRDIGKALHEKKYKKFVVAECKACGKEWSRAYNPKKILACKCGAIPETKIVELPLSPNTLRRIEAGLLEHCGISFALERRDDPEGKRSRTRPVTKPMQTLTCSSNIGLVSAFALGQQSGATARDVKEPMPTISTGGAIGLINAFAIQTDQTGGNGKCVRGIGKPMFTIVTKQNAGLVSFAVSTAHGKNSSDDMHRVKSILKPLPTLKCTGEWILVNPFIISTRGTSKSHIEASAKTVKGPIGVLTTNHHHALVQPFVTSYYGKSTSKKVSEPLPTTTTKDRFALVNVKTNERHELVIFYRLFKLKELAAAHSFPADYQFAGNNTQGVKQVGNSNPIELTAALTACVME